jgi:hypothetical protein
MAAPLDHETQSGIYQGKRSRKMAGSPEGRMDVPELWSGNKMVPESLRVRP